MTATSVGPRERTLVVDIMSNIREAVKTNGIDGSASCRPNNFLPARLSTAASGGTKVMNI